MQPIINYCSNQKLIDIRVCNGIDPIDPTIKKQKSQPGHFLIINLKRRLFIVVCICVIRESAFYALDRNV